jgi:hypothetical protein
MNFVIALSNQNADWASPQSANTNLSQAEPTLYTIGIIVCLALLLLWYGVVRRPG